MHAIVIKIKALPDYKLHAIFKNGEIRIYDVTSWIKNHAAFAPLATMKGLFEQVKVDAGGFGISWNDDIDLDADELWFNGKIPA